MPTMSAAVVFDNLLHPNKPSSYSYPNSNSNSNAASNQQHHNHSDDPYPNPNSSNNNPVHIIMPSPSLYTTPQQHIPIWDHTPLSPTSPSPYLINYKRRLPSSTRSNQNQMDVLITEQAGGGGGDGDGGVSSPPAKDDPSNGGGDSLPVVEDKEEKRDRDVDDDDDDFFDPRESLSIASSSSSDVEDGLGLSKSRSRSGRQRFLFRNNNYSSLSSQSDYYDAAEDFFSDGSVSNSCASFNTSFHKELEALRLSLIEEVERRRKAEENLLYIQMQWQKIPACLSQVGLTFPEPQHSENLQLELDPAAICQEIIVTRFVSEAIARAMARAETEIITEAIIDSKNHEISRLRDRLQYYEAVNHEMSQRNQEAVELSRQRRLKRRMKQKLIWGCVGLSITFGASVLAYSYIPGFVKHTLPTSSPDGSAPGNIDVHGD